MHPISSQFLSLLALCMLQFLNQLASSLLALYQLNNQLTQILPWSYLLKSPLERSALILVKPPAAQLFSFTAAQLLTLTAVQYRRDSVVQCRGDPATQQPRV